MTFEEYLEKVMGEPLDEKQRFMVNNIPYRETHSILDPGVFHKVEDDEPWKAKRSGYKENN